VVSSKNFASFHIGEEFDRGEDLQIAPEIGHRAVFIA